MTAICFEVRYSTSLKVTTGLVSVLFLAIAAFGWFGVFQVPHPHGDADLTHWRFVEFAPWVLFAATALFTVLRYEIDDAGLHVVRPIGRLRIASIVSSLDAPDALKGVMRTFGNGGLFSYTGWYSLHGYGSCRFWVTDLRHVVVMRGDRGCVVVSPARRDDFVAAVRSRFGIVP